MLIEVARNQNRTCLSEGHDYDKGDGSEGIDGVVNEKLSDGRTEGKGQAIEGKGRKLGHENEGSHKGSLLEEGGKGKETGKEVYAGHHLERRHLVSVEQLVLPIRSKGVGCHVSD